MKLASISLLLALGSLVSALHADDVAKITQSVNVVRHGNTDSEIASPAPVGTTIQNGEYVKTGKKSRAELEFSSDTITRLGANTIYNYDASANTGSLKEGSVLFGKPKDGKTFELKTPGVTAAIVGCVILVSYDRKTQTSEVLNDAGKISVRIAGKVYPLLAGQGVIYTPGKPPYFFFFNRKKNIQTCALLTDFGPLPPYNEHELKETIADGAVVDVGPPNGNNNAPQVLGEIQNPPAQPPAVVVNTPPPVVQRPQPPKPPPVNNNPSNNFNGNGFNTGARTKN